eukprot:GGOE01005821.1.p1 GENE.GGOE01005821.1~~GGOE01005821.1.p1  ORF type:complete len:195 (-),score=58.51 GGOE01005821.1:490-1074(-)
MPSPLNKMRSHGLDSLADHNWGVDGDGQFYERAGRTKLCSQLSGEDKRYISSISTKDLPVQCLGELVKAGLELLKGFKMVLYCTDTYFHARYTYWVVHATDDIEVFISLSTGTIHFRASTKDSINGFGRRHRHRLQQLVEWLQPKINSAAEKQMAELRTSRINEWNSAVLAVKPNSHYEADLDDPTSVVIPDTP